MQDDKWKYMSADISMLFLVSMWRLGFRGIDNTSMYSDSIPFVARMKK